MTETPPELPVERSRRRLWDRVSIIWLIPVAALAIALGVAWQSWVNRGPLIEITFENASGITVGETELRFRDIAVGVVEEVEFSDDLGKVVVGVRVDEDVARYVDEGAVFWVVRPQVSTRGVSGLNTVLSGVYIEGLWDAEPGQSQRSFDGRSEAPLVRPGEEGLLIRLRSTGGEGFSDETPILYRGIEVGRLGRSRVAEDGAGAVAEAVIYAPHDRLISSATRFWDTSGFTFSLGANGADINFNSIASLLSGGITFDTPVSGGEPVEKGTTFRVYVDQGAARNSAFDSAAGTTIELAAVFDENMSGLEPGAPVELRGLQVGEVTDLSGIVDKERFGDNRVRLLTRFSLRPSLLGLPEDADRQATLDFLAQRVSEGLRARLATASILSGGLRVELVEVGDAADATLDREAEPPLFPTTESDVMDHSATAQGVFERINDLPIEEVMASTVAFLDSATALVSNQELQETPGALRDLLAEAQGVVGSDEVQALPGQVSGLVGELQSTTAEMRSVLAQIEEADAVGRLLAAVDAAAAAAESADTAVAEVPALIQRLEAVAARAESLPVQELVDELSGLVDSADAVIATEGAQELPAALTSALGEIEAVLAELRDSGTVENANETLAAARRAAGTLEEAAGRLPALVGQANALLAQAETTLGDYDSDSEVARQARTALREVQRAATAVSSLARTLERDPNSILLGR